MSRLRALCWLGVGIGIGLAASPSVSKLPTERSAEAAGAKPTLKKWVKGEGWGWVWGADDEIGSLNEMTDASRLAALRLVERGKVYDGGSGAGEDD